MARLWPVVPNPAVICAKLTENMSENHWDEWVSPDIPYITTCPGLPVSPD
jgi:hypothetical protein